MNSAFAFGMLPLLMMMGVMSGPQNVDPEASQRGFQTIAQHLQKGGSHYQVEYVEGASQQMVERMVQFVRTAAPADAKEIIASIQPMLAKNGFFDLKGRGASIRAGEDGLKQTRMFWMVDEADQKKPLWQGIYGESSDPSPLLQYLPEQTELCLALNADTQAVWGMVKEAILTLGAQGDPQRLDEIIDDLKEEDLSPVMLAESLTGRAVVGLQLDPEVTVPLPLGRERIQVPMPSFVAVLGVRSDAFQEELTRLLTEEGNFSKTTQELAGQTVVSCQPTRPMPIPLVVSFLRVGDRLVIGSNLGVMEQALTAAENGNGLLSRGRFQSLPVKGLKTSHGMFYMGAGCAKLLNEARSKVLAQPESLEGPAALLALLDPFPEQPCGWMLSSDKSGYLLEGRGNGMLPTLAGSPNLAMIMPYFLVSARAVSHSRAVATNRPQAPVPQRVNSCEENLRMIDFAKESWAIDSGAAEGETPNWNDLTPFFKDRRKPQCPQGGTYSIKPLGTRPECSVPGHSLR